MWIHIPQSTELASTADFARFRLSTFVILSIFFLASSQHAHPGRGFKEYALARLRILYLPFLAWAGVYFLWAAALAWFFHTGQMPRITLQFPVTGQTWHLWFLPFILVAGLVTFPVAQRWHGARRNLGWIIAGLMLVGLAAAGAATPLAAYCSANFPVEAQSARSMVEHTITLAPCLPLGLAVYYLFRRTREHSGSGRKWMSGAGVLLLAGCAGYNLARPTNALLEAVAGMGLVLIAFWPARSWIAVQLGRLGRYSYGMYLVHIIFVTLFRDMREYGLGMAPTWWYDLLTWVMCVLLSLGTAMVLARFRATRWLIAAPPVAKREKHPGS